MKKYKKYIGIPYKDKGRSTDGVDCWGLVRMVMSENMFIELPSYTYDNEDCAGLDSLIAQKKIDWIEVEKPSEGDIILLRQLNTASHVGIMVDKRTFIHSSMGGGVIAAEISDARWRNRIVGYYRHSGLAKVRVVTQESLLRSDTIECTFEPGTDLQTIVNSTPAVEWLDYAHVSVQGHPVPPERWAETTIQRGALVTIVLAPNGDSGILPALLSIAVLALTGPGFFVSNLLGVSAAIGQGIAGIVGMLVINAICPIPKQDLLGNTSGTDISNIYSISGPSNRINQYGAVPVILGQHKQVPPYAAKPYTSIVGDDLYFHGIFLLGYGPLDVSLIRLGETPLSSYPDVEYEIQDGSAPYVPSSLVPSNVTEESLSVTLNYDDGYTQRTSTTETDEISVDLVFPQGLCIVNDDGSLATRRISVHAQYKDSSSGVYLPAIGHWVDTPTIDSVGSGYTNGIHALVFTGGGGSGAVGTVRVLNGTLYSIDYTVYGNGYDTAPTITFPTAGAGTGGAITADIVEGHVFAGKSRQPFRHNFTLPLAAQSQYDYQMKRASPEDTSDKSGQYLDTVSWIAFRSVSYNPVINIDYNAAFLIVKMRATDSLNGQIQNLSCLTQSMGKAWNPTTEVWDDDQVLSNPGDLYRLALQGPWRKKPSTDASIDLDSLIEWNEFCYLSTTQFTFAYILDVKRPLYELLDLIAAAGRASRSKNNNKHSVIIDQARTLPKQIFTTANSNNLRKARTFFSPPDCMRVKFVDAESDWQQQERLVYNDGKDSSNSEVYTSLEFPGVTNAAQIWKMARYYIGCAISRQKQIILDADFEWLGCGRSDLVHVANDVILVGLAGGRVHAATPATITVRNACEMETGKSYSVEIRKTATGDIDIWPVLTVTGKNYSLTRAGIIDFDCAKDDVFSFGETGKTSLPCLVQSAQPKNDLAATLTMVPYDEDVYLLAEGTVPSWDPVMSLPISLVSPDPPRAIAADEYLYSEEGSPVQGVSVSWTPPENTLVSSYELQVYRPNGSGWDIVYNGSTPLFDLRNTQPGLYSFRVRSRRELLVSTWLTLADETIDSLATAAADVLNLRLITRNLSATLVWDAVRDIRPVTYEIRNGETGWDEAVVVGTTSEVSYLPTLRGTYLVKAQADAGYSTNAATISLAGEELPINIVQEISEDDEGWDGVFTNCSPAEPEVMTKSYDPITLNEPDAEGWTLSGTDDASIPSSGAYLLISAGANLCSYGYTVTTGNYLFCEAILNSVDESQGYIELLRADTDGTYNRLQVHIGTKILGSYVTDLTTSTNYSIGNLKTYQPTKITIKIIKDYVWIFIDDEQVLSMDIGSLTAATSSSVKWGKTGNVNDSGTIEWYGIDFYTGDIEGVKFQGNVSQDAGVYTTHEDNILDVGSDKNVLIQAPELDWTVTEGTGSLIPELRVRKDGRDVQYNVREDVAIYDITDVKVNRGVTGYSEDFDIVYTTSSTDPMTPGVEPLLPDLTWTVVKEVRGEVWSVAGEKNYTLDTVIPTTATAWGIRSYKEAGTPAILEISGHISSTSGRVDGKLTSYSTSIGWDSSATSVTSPNSAYRGINYYPGYFWQASALASTTPQVLTFMFPSARGADIIKIFRNAALPGSEPEDYTVEVEENGSWVAIATIVGQTWPGTQKSHSFTDKLITGYRISISKTIDNAVLPVIDHSTCSFNGTTVEPSNIISDHSNAVTVEAFCSGATTGQEGWRGFDYSTSSYWGYPADTRDVATWGEWIPVVAGEYLGRWFNTRIRAELLDELSVLIAREWKRILDMPDIAGKGTEVIASGGSAVTFSKVFQVAPSLGHGLINGTTGDTVDITSLTTTGFTATIYDSSKVTKAGTLSYIVSGY